MFKFASLCLLTGGLLSPSALAASSATLAFGALDIKDAKTGGLLLSVDGLRDTAEARFTQLGYTTVKTDDIVFEKKGVATQARFRLDGHLVALSCDATLSERTCQATVRWDLFDSVWNAPIYEVQTRGVTVQKNNSATPEQYTDTILNAMDRTLARPGLAEAMRANGGEHDALPRPHWTEPLEVRACPSRARRMPEDLQEAVDAVAILRTPDGVGSGVFVSPDGFVATAAHVVAGHDEVEVRTSKDLLLIGTVVRIDSAHDVAVVRVPGEGHPCLSVRQKPASLGAPLVAIGAPGGEALASTVSRGIVSSQRSWNGYSFLQTDASINPGNSGGPLLDEYGRIAAVVSWKVGGSSFEGLAFGVPVSAWQERLVVKFGERSADTSPAALDAAGGTDAHMLVIDSPDPDLEPTQHTADRRKAAQVVMWGGVGLFAIGGLDSRNRVVNAEPIRGVDAAMMVTGALAAAAGRVVYRFGPPVSRTQVSVGPGQITLLGSF